MKFARVTLSIALATALVACGSSGGAPSIGDTNQLTLLPQTVTGTLVESGTAGARLTAAGQFVRVDDRTFEWPVGDDGRFACTDLLDGDHSLFVYGFGRMPIEIPFRMLDGRGLDLGRVTLRDDRVIDMTGFDGYRSGFVDEDGDGINDWFADADGDGYCDEGKPLAGYPYMMNRGYADANRDGMNDRYRDRDGDHRNDIDGRPCAPSFGWVDEDRDGLHDLFRDADGDGICDMSGMPFGHRFGYSDDNADGINDRFRDANGDCINDVTGEPYASMPGWVDLDGDGMNDFFRDADGDGMHDDPNRPLPYSHGCGWVDANGDGTNDRFVDANGDSINDEMLGPYAEFEYHYGFRMQHIDVQGDGIDDETGEPYCQGFGWVDADRDGVNDAFSDQDGNGVNDMDGHRYDAGYGPGGEHSHDGPGMDPNDWPRSGSMGMRR